VDAFNALNHVNYDTYIGNLSSPFFGEAVSAKPPRRIELAFKIDFWGTTGYFAATAA
jgi:hypothetical protein